MEVFQSSAIFAVIIQSSIFVGARIRQRQTLNPKDRLLLLFITNLFLHFCNIYIVQSKLLEINIKLHSVFCVTYGPILWLSLKACKAEEFTFYKREILHFTPAVLLLLLTIVSIYYPTGLETPLVRKFIFAQTFLYLILIFIEIYLRKYNRALGWLRWILPIFTLLVIVAFIDYLRWKYALSINATSILTSPAFIALILISGLMYKGLNHNFLDNEKNCTLNLPKNRYINTLLTDGKKIQMAKEIRLYFEREKPYLNCSLVITDISNALNIPTYLISRVINESLGYTFPEFVNMHRVESAKELLVKTNLKILAITFDSGFGNKTNFNRVFKEFTKLSPSKYRDLNS